MESRTSFGCARASCCLMEHSRHGLKRGTGSDEIRALCPCSLSWDSHTGHGSRHSCPTFGVCAMKYKLSITTSSWCLVVQVVQLQAHSLRSLSPEQA